MLLSLCRCQLRHIHHASKNIVTSILGGRWCHGIWWISWSPTRNWISLQLWRCVMWRSGRLLTNWEQLRWIKDWIIQWRRHIYHWWWQLIYLWVTVLTIKELFITRGCSLPNLIISCSTFVATTNTLWTWKDECNMSLWWCCVPVIFCCWWPTKGESKRFRATVSLVFMFK